MTRMIRHNFNLFKLITSLFILVTSQSIQAQDNPYLAPIGAFEAITGNTGIARDGSVGAVIYNPAGLATVTTSKISGSASAFGLNSIRTQGKGYNDENNHINSIPTQITSIFTEKKFNWAFSILVPSSSTSKINRVTKTNDLGDYTENIDITAQDTLVGPSIGFAASDKFKFGLSVFLVKNEHRETSDTSYGLDTGTPKYLDVYRDENTALAVFPMLGFLYTPSKRFAFGVRFSAPSTQIDGHHESTLKQYQNDGTNGEQSRTDKQSKKRRYERPVDLGIGITYQYSEKLKILADISNQFSKKYYAYKYDAYGEDELIDYKNVTKYNIGVEYKTSQHDAVTLGLNYNPDPRKEEGYPFYNRLDFYGATFGYRDLESISDTTMGLFINHAQSQNSTSKTTYQIYGVFLSTAINFHK